MCLASDCGPETWPGGRHGDQDINTLFISHVGGGG